MDRIKKQSAYKIKVILFLLTFFVIFQGGLIYYLLKEIETNDKLVFQTFYVEDIIDKIYIKIISAQLYKLGYILTKDKQYYKDIKDSIGTSNNIANDTYCAKTNIKDLPIHSAIDCLLYLTKAKKNQEAYVNKIRKLVDNQFQNFSDNEQPFFKIEISNLNEITDIISQMYIIEEAFISEQFNISHNYYSFFIKFVICNLVIINLLLYISIFMIKKMETKLNKQNEELFEKNNQLIIENKKVEEATKIKSQFLANMSHELRTPLNAIIGFSDLMYSERVGKITAEHKAFLQDILTSSHHLLKLINDVLDIAKIESGKEDFYPENVNLHNLIIDICFTTKPLYENKALQLDVQNKLKDNIVFIDPYKFKQIAYNFLSNAIKYSPEGSTIIITTKEYDQNNFYFEVEDKGQGISEEDKDKIFNEFQSLHSKSKGHESTGLGLVLTKKLVEAIGGFVGFESTLGKGSKFYAVLPKKFTNIHYKSNEDA